MDLSSNETPLVPQAEEIIWSSECLLLQTATVPRLSKEMFSIYAYMLPREVCNVND